MSDRQYKCCETCGFWYSSCCCTTKDQANESMPPDAVASRCSHGGDNAVGIAARSHDSALDQQRREFWQARYAFAEAQMMRHSVCVKYADQGLAEFDKRFDRDRGRKPANSAKTR